MRIVPTLCLLGLVAAPAGAQAPKRTGAAESPIASSVELPSGMRLVYVSGQVPEVANAAAAEGSVERYGDTEAQTRSVIKKIEDVLKGHGLSLSDVVMMRGYRAFFGTKEQPNKPARSTMQVGGLVDPGWLVEIEVTAAKK